MNELFKIKDEISINILDRNKVIEIENKMRKMEQVELPVKHYFSLGVYARELFIPKGVILTGKIHKYEQLNILLKGDISVLIEGELKRIQAPYIVVSPPGTKRIAYAHEDTIWLTVHGTYETDLAKIEEYFVCDTEQQFLEFCGQQRLELEG
jgi:hypothetical protein